MTLSKPAVGRGFLALVAFLFGLQVFSTVALSALGVDLSPRMIQVMLTFDGVAAVALLAGWRLCGAAGFAAAATFATFLVFANSAILFTYACIAASASFPLVDLQLAAIDAAIGFDWPRTVEWFASWPLAITVFELFYHQTKLAILFVLVFLCVTREHQRLLAFLWLFTLTCLASSVIALVLPAVGAFIHHAPPTELRAAIPADAGVWHLNHFQKLRSGEFHLFEPGRAQGLITFPSFHTAGVLLIPIALRGYGPLTIAAVVVAAIVVVSTIPIGGHYLIDVFAGAALAFAMLPLANRIVAATTGDIGRGVEMAPQPATP